MALRLLTAAKSLRSNTGSNGKSNYNYQQRFSFHSESTRISTVSATKSNRSSTLLGAGAVIGLGVVAMNQLLKNDKEEEETTSILNSLLETYTAEVYAAENLPVEGIPGTNNERTFIAIKPDGVNRNLIADIISRFERKGFKLVGIKIVTPTQKFAEQHYADLAGRPFFAGLVKYFSSGPVVAMVWEGKGVILTGRKIIGATDPTKAEPGTIRGDYCVQVGRNIIHGSDGVDSASHEINLWFKPEEIANWNRTLDSWINEAN